MKIYKKSMLIEESDNVVVAVEPIQAGECTLVAGEEITANEYIKEGHKIARVDIEKGAEIIKYGVHIGVATQPRRSAWSCLCLSSAGRSCLLPLRKVISALTVRFWYF